MIVKEAGVIHTIPLAALGMIDQIGLGVALAMGAAAVASLPCDSR